MACSALGVSRALKCTWAVILQPAAVHQIAVDVMTDIAQGLREHGFVGSGARIDELAAALVSCGFFAFEDLNGATGCTHSAHVWQLRRKFPPRAAGSWRT